MPLLVIVNALEADNNKDLKTNFALDVLKFRKDLFALVSADCPLCRMLP